MATFWSTADVEPKRGFRFLVQIGAGADSEVIWWAKSVNTPSFDVGEVEHSFLGNKYYFPGKVSWSTVNLTLVDPVSPDAVFKTNQYLIGSGYMIPDGTVDVGSVQAETISKVKAVSSGLGDVLIQVLNADGDFIEKWTLNNAFVKSVKFGDLSYEDDALRTVELEIRYDWASCEFGPGADAEAQAAGTQFQLGVPPTT